MKARPRRFWVSRSWANPLAAARRLKALGPRGVVLKLGEAGVVLLEDDAPLLLPAHKVEAVDTTAAGDAFNGAFAVALSEGRSAMEAVTFRGRGGGDLGDTPWRAACDGFPQ